MTRNTHEEVAPTVYLLDDDHSIRESLSDLFLSVGIPARSFGSSREFLEGADIAAPGCILLDVRLPGVSGLDFYRELNRIGSKLPVIFLTGYGDIPMGIQAMKDGAVDFLTKPFRDQDVLDAVTVALARDAAARKAVAATQDVRRLLESLTPREREVLTAVNKGFMNKQIAYQLGISEVTVKLHRGSVMRKMQVRTLADLLKKMHQITGT
ncbi:response regulator transcription factor [Rhizobium leguminosarum]|uniref:response regulator transcription factor n=1 Tax=Rhizobium TaxID=379 RepID=UPI001441D31C|nr:response regulator transcription factor [Rhizobium leguminosarum]MBY5416194.1 response regulator transcription factor [Rhizobium leguminosarum]MCA2434889.1 response regulator transcription factor [Rhizobium leguminosarum]NKK09758.1 response regulator [Rhizobium leguminosarum bv. viciae]